MVYGKDDIMTRRISITALLLFLLCLGSVVWAGEVITRDLPVTSMPVTEDTTSVFISGGPALSVAPVTVLPVAEQPVRVDQKLIAGIAIDDQNDDAQQSALEGIIIAVRSKLEIDASFNQFESSFYQEMTGPISYYLRWFDSKGNSIYVTANARGDIISLDNYTGYDMYSYQGKPRFPLLNKAQVLDLATGYIEQICPELADLLDPNPTFYLNRYSGYVLYYEHLLNGIPVEGDRLSLTIDQDNGALRHLYRDWRATEYNHTDDPAKALAPSVAWETLQREAGLELRYRLLYDYDAYYKATPETPYTPEVILEYAWRKSPSYYIDALTGDIYYPPRDEYSIYGGMGGSSLMAEMGINDEARMEELTPQERERVEALADLISAEEAIASLRRMPYLEFSPELKPNSINYNPDYNDRNLEILYIYFSNDSQVREEGQLYRWASASFDARSGDLLSFSSTVQRETPYRWFQPYKLSGERREEMTRTAISFLEAVKPELSSQVNLHDVMTGETILPYWQENLTLSFVRQVNGLPLEDDYLMVEINLESGKVVGFQQRWHQDLTFPTPAPVISLEEAYAAIAGIESPALSYVVVPAILTEEDELMSYPTAFDAKLVYNLARISWVSVDAHTGSIYQEGSPYMSVSETGDHQYNDIQDLPEAFKVLAVADYLKLPYAESFEPEEQITQAEFLRWVNGIYYEGYLLRDDESFYYSLRYTGFWDESYNDPDKLLTAMDGVKYFVRFLDYGPYLRMLGLFVNPLGLSDEDAAYVALAVGNNAITFAAFEPQAILTRYDAAVMIYNFLARK